MRKIILAVTGFAFGFTACSSYDSSAVVSVDRKPVASVLVNLPLRTLLPGQTQHATAAAVDASGTPLTDRAITWQSSLPTVATVDGSGVISAVTPGQTTISASAEGVSGQGALTVMTPPPVPVASVSISPSGPSLQVGATAQLTATTKDANGNDLSGRAVTWASTNPGVASISSTGVLTGVSAGTATLSATSEGQVGTTAATVTTAPPVPVASVSVSPSAPSVQTGATVQLTATLRDASGNTLTGRVVSWASANPSVASVSATGLVSGVNAGSTSVSATSEGQVGNATITVTVPAPVPVASVTVSPATSNLQVGATAQLSAVTRDASGNVLTGRSIVWSSSNAAFASVSSTGLVSAVAAGTATISATSEGRVGTAAVTVTAPAAVASVTVSLPQSSIVIGQNIQASAVLRDANNNVLTGRTVVWSSGNTAVATVSGSGVVLGVAQGTTTVIATSGTVSGNASVSVTPASTGGAAPEPGASDVVIFSDNYDRPTVALLTQGYATRGDMVPVADGHSGSAIRFPYTAANYDNLIEKNLGGSYTDIYFRYWYRTSPGMDPTCGDRGGSGMKWFMPWRASTNVRYTMGVGDLSNGPTGRDNIGKEFSSHDNTSTDEPNPFLSNVNNSIRLNTTNDGQWHKYTLHVVTSLGDGTGYEQIWIDGVLILDNSAFHYHHMAEGIAMVQFPGTVVTWFTGCDFTIDVDDFVAWHN